MRFLPVNRQALLVELADLDETLALLGSLQREPIAGVQELVPAARTVLVQFTPAQVGVAELVNRIAARDLSQRAERSDVLVEIPVHYDGEDLADVAQLLGITPEEVVRRHTGSEYAVAFTGFAPGFAYLSGGDPIFNVPRRTTPRTRVPAGSVALGGTFSAVYPQASPGGWQLIGRTSARMWDLARELPALLQPGYRVRFVDAAGMEQADAEPAPAVVQAELPEGNALRVKATGLMTLFQDRGRLGQAGQGVSASGAMDQAAFKAANRLVGNASDLAVLETVGGGLSLQSQGETVVAITGADAPLTVTTGSGQRWSVPRYQAVALADGDLLTIAQPVAGARCYVAVRGGFAVTPVLGSACTDTLANVGPAALAVGQILPVRAGRGAGRGTGPAHRLVHARCRGPAGRAALAGHAAIEPRGPARGGRAAPGARRGRRAAQRRHAAGRHPGAPQRPARAVPGRPSADGRLSRHRLRGAAPPRSGRPNSRGRLDPLQPHSRLRGIFPRRARRPAPAEQLKVLR